MTLDEKFKDVSDLTHIYNYHVKNTPLYFKIGGKPVLYIFQSCKTPEKVMQEAINSLLPEGIDFCLFADGWIAKPPAWCHAVGQYAVHDWGNDYASLKPFYESAAMWRERSGKLICAPIQGYFNKNGFIWGYNDHGTMIDITGGLCSEYQADYIVITSGNEGCAAQPAPGLENTGIFVPNLNPLQPLPPLMGATKQKLTVWGNRPVWQPKNT